MKHAGSSSSLRPARDAARAAERARVPHGGAMSLGAAAGLRTATASALAPWALGTDEAGNLVAHLPDGTARLLAAHPAPDEQENG